MKFEILIASDINLIQFVNPCVQSIRNCGYEPIIYDLGGLNFGIPFEADTSDKSLRKFPKKPQVIKHALEKLSKNSWLAWLDIDCIMKLPIDEVISQDFDVGLTFRKNHINSGVNFWKHSTQTLDFLDMWAAQSLNMGGDQNGLNSICKITDKFLIDKTVDINNTKVKIFDARIYNNFFFKKNQDCAKILHYKSKFRDIFPFEN